VEDARFQRQRVPQLAPQVVRSLGFLVVDARFDVALFDAVLCERRTGRQLANRYVLALESDFNPDIGRLKEVCSVEPLWLEAAKSREFRRL